MKRTGVTTFVYLAASFLFAPPLPQAVAASDTFTGAKDAAFSNSGNWQSGETPPALGYYDLFFAPTAKPDGSYQLSFDTPILARSLTFKPGVSDLQFQTDNHSLLGLGVGGITTQSQNNLSFSRTTLSVPLSLFFSQNWVVGEKTELRVNDLSGYADLSKGGLGTLTLKGGTGYHGDILIQSGALNLVDSAGLGSGRVTLQSNSTLQAASTQVALSNRLFLQSSTTLANQLADTQDSQLTLSGIVKMLGTNSVVTLGNRLLTTLSGTLDGPANSTVTFTGPGRIELTGTVSPNITSLYFNTTGGTLFSSPDALPAGVSLSAGAGSSVGVLGNGSNNNDLLASTLARITAPASFAGQLNLESGATSNTYSGTLNLSGFTSPSFSLGTESNATLASDTVITPPAGGFRLGGGGGSLKVAAPLNGAVGLQVSSPAQTPTRVFLQGDNTFTGSLDISHSLVYLDSPKALPDNATINLGSSGYVGYTPNWGGSKSLSDLVARINSVDAAGTSVIGFDGQNPDSGSVVVTGPVNLGGFNSVYLGTTTLQATLQPSATITAPADGVLRLAALRGSTLEIRSDLSPSNGVNSVVLGHPDTALSGAKGNYKLTGNNSYTGPTQVNQGLIEVSSATPFGLGTLTLNQATLQLGNAGSAALSQALPNTLVLGNGSRLSGSGEIQAPGGLNLGNGAWIAPGYTAAASNGQDIRRSLSLGNSVTFAGGGGYELIVADPAGAAGTGYSTLNTAGSLDFSSTSLDKFNFKLISYSSDGNTGALGGLGAGTHYSLVLATAALGISNFDTSRVALDTGSFLTGSYSVGDFSFNVLGAAGGSQQLILSFTPIPEPETWALMAGGAATLLLPLLRRRRKG